MRRCAIFVYVLSACTCLAVTVFAQDSARPAPVVAAGSSSSAVPVVTGSASTATHSSSVLPSSSPSKEKAAIESSRRIEGEDRFRTNCGRCHMPPHKFPPRVMATAIRHMRVRATLTDEDMRLILDYMTQ